MTISGRRVAGAGRPHDTDTPDVETSSAGYASRFSGSVGRFLLEQQSNAVRTLLSGVTSVPIRVLDVGGGHGQLISLFSGAGHEVTVHGSRFSCFERIVPNLRANAAGSVSELWGLPFRDKTFGLVAGIRLLAHVTRWRELLAEMGRVSETFLLVDFPTATGVQRLSDSFFGLKRGVEKNTRPYFTYTRDEIVSFLVSIGFRRVAHVGQFVLPMAFHRLARWPTVSRVLERSLATTGLSHSYGSPVLLLAERNPAAEP